MILFSIPFFISICLNPSPRDDDDGLLLHCSLERRKMMKLVLKVDLSDSKLRREAMKAVSGLHGVDSLSTSTDKKTLTVVGNVDPVEVVSKLRKLTAVEIETAGPNKEEEKKKDEGKEKDDKNKNKELEEMIRNFYLNNGYYPYHQPPNYYYYSY